MSEKSVKTIADIARLAGVSKSTVSRALNDSELISTATRARIQAIAREHNFQVNQPARSLSLKRTNTIAFVTHGYYKKIGVDDLFLLEMMGALAGALAALQYDLLLVHVDPYATDWISDYIGAGKVDGFVLMTWARKVQHVEALLATETPFIAWGAPVSDSAYCTVTGDNFNGGRLAAAHLISLGCRRIAFLGGPAGDKEVSLRYAGYAAALRAAGREIDAELVVHGHYATAAGAGLMAELLARQPAVDGVVTNSDLMAIGAMQAIRASGRQVPRDICVVGYDDLSLARYTHPPLTTIRQNIGESGRLLAQNLVSYLETGLVTNVIVPVDLIVRESTAPR